ncbi:DNA replication and repair protein RecO [Anaerobranca californiensis DSM 14826]|jgi:DNA repair protein RecO (recombination protein O)|uniref:DNA repair protein RecO n=1 Tax=Anaerobranca californiensis DSM 14826 TaxID=1120989 RepID=A0A1M6N5Z7_9FIRM|nr:DNA repair protein RecO [Anaerobranca californiensis]SHJ91147.1 DNA replication and repair protein RecO [Anaerobranca californiensis DSM 14826]
MLYKTTGIVIKTFPYREADMIVRIFSLKKGKMDMLAKGTKKIKSKLAATVQPFTYGEYTFYQKNYNLAVLRQSEIIANYKNIISDLKLTFMGYYICEFIDYFLQENQGHPRFFALTVKTLEFINNFPDQSHAIFTAFKIKGISLMGFTPTLTNCIKCGFKDENLKFIFSVKEGGLLCSKCVPENNLFLPKKEILLLLFLLKSTYEEILKVNLTSEQLKTVESIIGKYINYHCEGHVFNSEGLLKKLT